MLEEHERALRRGATLMAGGGRLWHELGCLSYHVAVWRTVMERIE